MIPSWSTMLLDEEKWAQQEREQAELERQPHRQVRIAAHLMPNNRELIGARRKRREQAREGESE